jgi:hypothetical protein
MVSTEVGIRAAIRKINILRAAMRAIDTRSIKTVMVFIPSI